MRANYEASLDAVLKHEGGYVNHPKDPGGATNKGVTQAVYDGYRKRNGLRTLSVKSIADHEVGTIYKTQYWDAVRGDDLPSGIDYCTFDFAVNSGPGRSVRFLQEILGVMPDGLVGNITLAAAKDADSKDAINRVCDKRMAFLKGLPTWGTFGKGWTSRVAGVRALALAMAAKPPEKPVEPVSPVPVPEAKKPRVSPVGAFLALLAMAAAAFAAWMGWK